MSNPNYLPPQMDDSAIKPVLVTQAESELSRLRAEVDALRAQLAEREEDRALLDWLLDFITQNGAGGIADLEWTCTNPDEADELTPDRMDIAFDRAAIRAARAQEDGK